MELTVYRQSSKTRPDGTTVYKGEDARPYVDGQIFFVADGLGGAAAIRHQKIKPELFDEDQLLDTLFSGVYDDYGNETFAAYVKESFFELFAVKDCYTDNINNIKKSGYFASRIVTAIILHEMLYNDAYSAESIFSTLAARGSEAERAAYLGTLGRYFRDLIQGKIRQIARNANLVYESAYSGRDRVFGARGPCGGTLPDRGGFPPVRVDGGRRALPGAPGPGRQRRRHDELHQGE